MNNLLKEIMVLFIIIVFSNVLVSFAGCKDVLANPIRFFGAAIVISIIGGFVTKWIKFRALEANTKG
ncbi:MAG: glycerol uptake facilitator-like aquaporin [Saprospiraceae bacterium]|jgi:glycerol uptake facilitator-like aquaporin|tara:strand:+ start:762 stop:962 length:201 start_codon:yes stop_codon:yes gene_type:complete